MFCFTETALNLIFRASVKTRTSVLPLLRHLPTGVIASSRGRELELVSDWLLDQRGGTLTHD